MNSYSQIFANCWHSSEKPCAHYIECINNGQKCHQSAESKKQLNAFKRDILLEEHSEPVILIGMGTCGLANGAQRVFSAMQSELEKMSLKVKIVPTGCFGYCSREVIVDIKLPGRSRICYQQVTVSDVPELLRKTLVEQQVYEEKLLGLYPASSGSKGWGDLPYLNDLPFFAKQKKMVLENCGIIDPESIDQYLARGGYKGLATAINTMKPAEVVQDMLKSGLRGRGGGGFPTGKKWEFAQNQKSRKNI